LTGNGGTGSGRLVNGQLMGLFAKGTHEGDNVSNGNESRGYRNRCSQVSGRGLNIQMVRFIGGGSIHEREDFYADILEK
jgi:hypothetical protein